MSAITPVTLITGLSTTHRCYMAQLRDCVVITNGFDANQQYSVRNASAGIAGIAVPVAAPTSAFIAGSLTGTYLYRVRWYDASAGAISNASAILPVNPAAQGVRITVPGSPPSRVTHWIVERTTNGGSTYYPLNQDFTHPNGTAIATTTYDDNVDDITLSARNSIPNNHGAPAPYRYCFANGPRIFLCSTDPHTPTVTVTNGSPTVTVTAGNNQFVPSGYDNTTTPLIGMYFFVPGDTDGVRYTISSVSNNAPSGHILTLNANYTSGTTRSAACSIVGRRDRIAWSEAGYPESYGGQAVGLLTNELILGDDGAAVTSGCGIGSEGVIWAKEQGLFLHSYFIDPDPVQGDGRISVLPTRRGALGPKSLRFIDGTIYGIDYRGIWAMTLGGVPREIGDALSSEWINNNINFTKGDNFHIGYDPFNRWVYFFVVENTATAPGSGTYPQKAYVYDLDEHEWIMTQTYPLGVTATTERTDTNGQVRMCYYQEATTGSGGSAGSFEYMASIGYTLGADPTSTPTFGTVTAGTASTLTDSTAAWITTSPALTGVAVQKISATTGASETHIISSNTATALTICDTWTANPAAGDTYYVGGIPSDLRTGRIFCGTVERKKEFYSLWIWVNYKANSTKLRIRVYKNGSLTPDSDQVATIVEDGITRTANTSEIIADPSATTTVNGTTVYRLKVPLNEITANDLQFELYSYEAAAPWEILSMKLFYDIEDRIMMPGEA